MFFSEETRILLKMDHLMFLMQERFESFQFTMGSVSSRVRSGLLAWHESGRNAISSALYTARESEFGLRIICQLKELLLKCKQYVYNLHPKEFYDRMLIFFLTEVTRVHYYFGGVCFIIGGIVGVAVGMKIQKSVVAPHKMRAVVINGYKGLESICVVEDVCAPRIIDPSQVLIQVKAAGIDYLDIRVAEGYGKALRKYLNKYNPNTSAEFPVVLGRDCAGIVVATGKDVTRVEEGDEVWLSVPIFHPGTLSEYIVVAEKLIAVKPLQLSYEGAAALPYCLMLAWDALVCQAGLTEDNTPGKRVLVHSGASGVGVIAIQLVHAWGGHVTTTVSSKAAPLAHMLGADDVITYDNSKYEKELLFREKYDVIFNTVGTVVHNSCLDFCIPGGIVVTATHPTLLSDSYGCVLGAIYSVYICLWSYFSKNPWLTGVDSRSILISGHLLDKVSYLIESGKIQPVVDKAFSAQDAEVAFAHIARGEQIGKTVVRFRSRPLTSRIDIY